MLTRLTIMMVIISVIITIIAVLFGFPFFFLVIFLPPIMITFSKQDRKYCPYCGAKMKGNVCPLCGFVSEEHEEEF